MPKGYWIAHIAVDDPEAYDAYRAGVGAVLSGYDAKFIVRAGASVCVEGTAKPRTVVIEFPSYQAAQDCYHAAAYQAVKALRVAAAAGDIVIAEGYDG